MVHWISNVGMVWRNLSIVIMSPLFVGIPTCTSFLLFNWGEPERAPHSRTLHRGFVVSVCPRAVCLSMRCLRDVCIRYLQFIQFNAFMVPTFK